jgi:hypothetical protein
MTSKPRAGWRRVSVRARRTMGFRDMGLALSGVVVGDDPRLLGL